MSRPTINRIKIFQTLMEQPLYYEHWMCVIFSVVYGLHKQYVPPSTICLLKDFPSEYLYHSWAFNSQQVATLN